MTSEKEVVVDALPYFDQGYDDPGVREAVCYILQIQSTHLSVLELGVSGNYFFSHYRSAKFDTRAQIALWD